MRRRPIECTAGTCSHIEPAEPTRSCINAHEEIDEIEAKRFCPFLSQTDGRKEGRFQKNLGTAKVHCAPERSANEQVHLSMHHRRV
ncbi:MAG: hypothetical protein O6768_08275 [Planctomycetota bacterium]|nr:hypothetical protein [Planctomycetota bacterium]